MKLKLATNIYKIFSAEIIKIQNAVKDYFDLEFLELAEKTTDVDQVNKFVFINIPIREMIKDASTLEHLEKLIILLLKNSLGKTSYKGIQLWFSDLSDNKILNVAFAIKDSDNVHDLIITMRDYLMNNQEIEKMESKKIAWVGLSAETNTWQTQIL